MQSRPQQPPLARCTNSPSSASDHPTPTRLRRDRAAAPPDRSAPDPAALNVILHCLDACFGTSPGWLAIKHGRAPAKAPRQFDQTRWFRWPAERQAAARFAATAAIQGYDVGFCVSLFRRRRITASAALPAAFLYADDLSTAHSPLQPHLVIHTSPHKPPQAIALLTHALAPAERAGLSRRWAEQAGADRSGWDCTQVLRLPATVTYKYAAPHPVTLEEREQPRHSREVVTAALASGSSTPAIQESRAFIQQGYTLVAGYTSIPARTLLNPAGLPRLLSSTALAARLWQASPREAARIGGREGRSGAYFSLVRGLLLAGYSPPQTMALALEHGAWGHEDGKPGHWLPDDTARIISKVLSDPRYDRHARQKRGGKKIARQRTASTATPRPRGRPRYREERSGRQLSAGAAQLLDWLIDHSVCRVVFETVGAIATALRRSERTIRNYLAELERTGLLQRTLIAGWPRIDLYAALDPTGQTASKQTTAPEATHNSAHTGETQPATGDTCRGGAESKSAQHDSESMDTPPEIRTGFVWNSPHVSARASAVPPAEQAVPDDETRSSAVAALRAFGVSEAVAREFAGLPPDVIAEVLKVANARLGLRSRAGWAVHMLRLVREQGWDAVKALVTPAASGPVADVRLMLERAKASGLFLSDDTVAVARASVADGEVALRADGLDVTSRTNADALGVGNGDAAPFSEADLREELRRRVAPDLWPLVGRLQFSFRAGVLSVLAESPAACAVVQQRLLLPIRAALRDTACISPRQIVVLTAR